MNVSKHDQKIILVILGLIVFLAAYFGVCKTFNEKKSGVESQISVLNSQLRELQGYSASKTTYEDGISKIDTDINVELVKYPNDVRSEDMVMYATKLEKEIGIIIDKISIVSPEVVSKFSVSKKSGESSTFAPVAAVRTGLTITCDLNYQQLKELIDYIYATSEKTAISKLAVGYNVETGKLLGVITIEKYFLASADYTYNETDIPSVPKGITDPFGSMTAPIASPTPSTTPNAG